MKTHKQLFNPVTTGLGGALFTKNTVSLALERLFDQPLHSGMDHLPLFLEIEI